MSIANQRRQRGKEERNSDLLIDRYGSEDGEIDMGVRREQGDQRDQKAGDDRDPALAIERYG
ncbi:hypothetical protein NZK32_14515 [Cyanobium sp. FGCU-52]|nr:hypothetical protein [Cyanobium sp. FGCU52]